MNHAIAARTSILGLCLIMLVASGCGHVVSEEQLSAVDAKATSAMSEARKAASDAAKALEAAAAAQSSADAAKAAADAAGSCCNDSNDRIERMFEKTMKK